MIGTSHITDWRQEFGVGILLGDQKRAMEHSQRGEKTAEHTHTAEIVGYDLPALASPSPAPTGQHTLRDHLCIKDLASDITESDLRQFFSRSGGTVTKVSVQRDSRTNRSLKCGFVSMASDKEALRAMKELNGYWLKGRVIKISAGGIALDTLSTEGQVNCKATTAADGQHVNSVKIDFNMVTSASEREIGEDALLKVFKFALSQDLAEAERLSRFIVDVSIQEQHYDKKRGVYGYAFVGFSLCSGGIQTAKYFQARFHATTVGPFHFRKIELSNRHYKFVQYFDKEQHRNVNYQQQVRDEEQQQCRPLKRVTVIAPSTQWDMEMDYIQMRAPLSVHAPVAIRYIQPIVVPGFASLPHAPIELSGAMFLPLHAYAHHAHQAYGDAGVKAMSQESGPLAAHDSMHFYHCEGAGAMAMSASQDNGDGDYEHELDCLAYDQ
jgi:RNA recognition motif-containing protein